MSTVQDIESAISRLSQHDLQELRAWFDDFAADAWDRQMEDDARSGRLESLYQKLARENESQPLRPLDEVLDDQKLS